ncbi:MAG: Ig-like domain-containing protein [Lachnospiraceae bacterium]|nr:Ig-like domain-containing protein [Lachnospiraceae bacterium]
MGKLFNINKILNGAPSGDSDLAAFEKDIVSLDDTGSIKLPEEFSDEYEDSEGYGDPLDEEYQSGPDEDEYAGEDEYAEEEVFSEESEADEYFEEDEYSEEDEYAETDDSSESDEYTESDEYAEADEYTESDEYAEADEYTESDEYAEADEYAESDEYAVNDTAEYTEETGRAVSYEEMEYPEEYEESLNAGDRAYDEYDEESSGEYYDEDYAEDYSDDSDDYPEDVKSEEPVLGFDEVRLDTASINASEISEHIRRSSLVKGRASGRKPGSTAEKVSGESDKGLSVNEYINLDESHEQVFEYESGKKNVLKLAIIAVACLALLAVGIIAIKNRIGSASASNVRITDAGIPVSDDLIGVGNELNGIEVIGQSGLASAFDERMAAAMAVADVQNPANEDLHTGYNETDIVTNTRVTIELISVKSDLKIRFINAESGKLIPNIPFVVTITYPSGKTETWTDDDMDGIIYRTSLTEGKYKIHIEPLDGDRYAGFSWPADDSITVKSTIEYERVDVESEVLDASQVNENAEDTASRGNTSQLDLTNTVEFLESTEKPVYTEIARDTIVNPLAAMTETGPYSIVFAADVSGNNSNPPAPQPAEKPTVTLSLSQTSMSLKAGAKGTFTVSYTITVARSCTLSVSSSNTAVATASISDKTVTVTAVAGGTADITVTATTDKSGNVTETATTSARCSVTVTNVDMTQLLTDKSGNEVYVLEDGKYRRATYADYSTFDKFYIISGTFYTGWQTINGSTYYYNAEGKPVTGTQVIQGVTYMFGADGKMTSTSGVLGIDVSKWQGKIDWAAVKASGVEYVIIRVGYRGSTAGALIDDSMFVSNITGARAAGLKVGVYFVTQAIDDVEAVYEASMVLDRIRGYTLDLPVFLDVEPSGGRGDRIDKATRTAVIVAFCETIRSAGYAAGIYANKTWLETKMDTSQFGNYKIWVAHYSSVCGYTGRYDMWQYTDKGTVSGINGSVDMDLRYT